MNKRQKQPWVQPCINGKPITKQEDRIVKYVLSNKELKLLHEFLGNSKHTAKTELENLKRKVGVQNVKDLAVAAMASGYDAQGNYHPAK